MVFGNAEIFFFRFGDDHKMLWFQKMPRTARMVVAGEKTAYHIMSRTALDGFPFGDMEKDELVERDLFEKERKKDFEITRTDRFRRRTKYFSDSGIIGSKRFVFTTYLQFKELFQSRHEKKPKTVKGLSGIYSLKRLAEA